MTLAEKFLNRDDPFAIQFTFLTIAGFWYLETKNKWKRSAYSVYRFLNVLSLTTVMFLEIIDILMISKDVSRGAERFCAATITCIISIRTHLTFRNSIRFEILHQKLLTFKRMKYKTLEYRLILDKATAQIILTAKIFYVAAVSGLCFWTFHPLLDGGRKLPFPFRLPVDVEQSPYYEICYVCSGMLLLTFTVSVVSMTLGFGSYIIIIHSHMEILKKTIESIERQREEVVTEKRLMYEFKMGKHYKMKCQSPEEIEVEEKRLMDDKTLEILKDAVETQQYIQEEIDSFKELYSKNLLVHIVGVLLAVAVVEISGVVEDFTIQLMKRILYITLGVFDIFCICLYGEILKHKSGEIARTLYMSLWYEMDIKVQKVLLIMSIRSTRSCILKAGDTIRLDFATFLNIVRTAYNFILLLRHAVSSTK